jgi:DNA-binding CsgD family transcriptional regulator
MPKASPLVGGGGSVAGTEFARGAGYASTGTVDVPVRASVLVARARELAALREAVDRAHQGAGGVVVVTGEAGVGKSRLLAEVVDHAATLDMTVLVGRAVEGGGPYRPMAEALYAHLRAMSEPDWALLRPFRPALARLLPGSPSGEAVAGVDPVVVLGEGVLRLLSRVAGPGGVLLVLEDLHWADRDTLALLEYLAPAVTGAAMLVLASARSDEEQPEPLRRLAGRPEVLPVRLGRLVPDEVARLASACAGGRALPAAVVEFLVEVSEGLPFLVEELLSGLVESGAVAAGTAWSVRGPLAAQVPRTLAELVRRRLARFEPPARRVVEAAAVVGHSVGWELLGPVTGLAEDTVVTGLRAAVSSYFLEADGDRFVWRHALMREAVLAQMLPPERSRLALGAAEALCTRDPQLAGPDAVLAADLYARGGAADRAAELLVRLARRAVAGGALQSADGLLDRAAALGAGTAAAIEQVRLLAFTGRGTEALDAGASALPGARGDERFALLLSLARAAVRAGRWPEAEAYLRRTGRQGDPHVDAVAADAAYGAGRVDQAARLAAEAASTAQHTGLPEVACEALEVVARCARSTDPPTAARAFRRAADLAEEYGLAPWRIRALLGLGTVDLQSGQTATLEHVRDLALDAGMLAEVAGADLLLADARGCIAGPAAAIGDAERSAELARQIRLDQTAAMALVFTAEGHAVAGRPGQRDTALHAASELAGAADVAAAGTMVLAVSALLDHDLPATRDWFDAAVALLRGHGSAAPLRHWGAWAVLRAVLDDRAAEARAELLRSPALARDVNRGALYYVDAVIAGRDGDPTEAQALLAAGDDILAWAHWWRRLLRLLVMEAALADRWGDPVADLRSDLAEFDAAGDWRLARTCRDLLRRAGAPVPRRGRGESHVPAHLRAAGVTSREMDVLTLVAQGLGNAQIADRLFLSPRTVETHVANLLAKLGASGRAQLGQHLPAGQHVKQ